MGLKYDPFYIIEWFIDVEYGDEFILNKKDFFDECLIKLFFDGNLFRLSEEYLVKSFFDGNLFGPLSDELFRLL